MGEGYISPNESRLINKTSQGEMTRREWRMVPPAIPPAQGHVQERKRDAPHDPPGGLPSGAGRLVG